MGEVNPFDEVDKGDNGEEIMPCGCTPYGEIKQLKVKTSLQMGTVVPPGPLGGAPQMVQLPIIALIVQCARCKFIVGFDLRMAEPESESKRIVQP